MSESAPTSPGASLARRIRLWARELGFSELRIARPHLETYAEDYRAWLRAGMHGAMGYMARNVALRLQPAALLPGTRSILSVRLDYWPGQAAEPWAVLADGERAYVSRYALGRDYHKLMRKRLQRLARRIEQAVGPFPYRAFADSAPVLEKPLAEQAGMGWIGKHTNLISPQAGSWFFLGELYTGLDLPPDEPAGGSHCGRCAACLEICPTRAIVAPYRLDARRCISYLTIEHPGPIPEPLRPLMGNRIYGCDDCQLVCPWNRFARPTAEADFQPRHGLDAARLTELFDWDEPTFLDRTAGSPIRRIGHERWLRNIAVALGNAPTTSPVVAALRRRADHPSALVREHVAWALARHAVGKDARV